MNKTKPLTTHGIVTVYIRSYGFDPAVVQSISKLPLTSVVFQMISTRAIPNVETIVKKFMTH